MAVSEQVILTLLEDTDSLSVAEAMRLIMSQCVAPEEFVSRHQDDENPQIRRHLQQLSRLLRRSHSRSALVSGLRSRKLSFWDGILLVGDLSDSRVNKDYLERSFSSFADQVLSGVRYDVRASTSQIVQAIRESSLYVGRGADFFDVGSLLLSEVLNTGQCHPLLLCELVRQIGRRAGWFGSIMICGGMYLLRTPEDVLLSPENDWNKVGMSSSQCRLCSDHEMLNAYLGLLQAMSVISHRPIGAFNFSQVLAEIHHTAIEHLPYPLGDCRVIPSKRSAGGSGHGKGSSPA